MIGMTPIVQTTSRLMAGLMFTFGVYIVVHGHLTPGGGFAGGVVIAGAFILGVLAYGAPKSRSETAKTRSSRVESLAIVSFWVIGLLGLALGAFYFENVLGTGERFELPSAGLIPFSNLAVGLEVAAALACIYLALMLTRGASEEEEQA